MIESTHDYENWRDSLRDNPIPEADEHQVRFYSHDYTADTTLEYNRQGERAELTLSFSSEDPDMGVEEMVYGGESRESMAELVSDLKSEITGYLDTMDTSSFYDQQGLPLEGANAYDEYSRTALYAFEAILSKTEKELQGELSWKPIESDKTDWLYSGSSEQDLERGCVGHLRGDFGKSGGEFRTSWFDHQPELKSPAFHEEFQNVVNSLRKQDGLLRNFASMNRGCREGLSCDDSFGFKAESPHYTYCLRCIPRRGDYNFYLYAYDKDAQREHALLKGRKEPKKQKTAKPKIKRNEMER